MYLFYDSTLNTWRLITEKLPEQPDPKDYTVDHTVPNNKYHRARMEYDAAIAALKQNALTVGNPRIIPRVGNDGFEIFKLDGNLHGWPGNYTKKKTAVARNGVAFYEMVAILTLPEEHTLTKENISATRLKPVSEEKKNTVENLTKEQAKEIVAKKHGLGTTLVTGHKASYWEEAMDLFASSGSVAAPKEETNESDDFYKIHALEYSYGDKKELPNSLQRKIHEEMFYYVSHMHPNQKYISDYYDLSKRATQVALDELASLRQQLAERTDWRKRMDALNEVMEPHGLKIVVYESGEWDLEQTIKRPR